MTSMSLDGLSKVLAQDEVLRSKLLKDDTLIAWPSPQLVGVHSNRDAQRLNSHLLKVVADYWCPQWDTPAMIPVDDAKWEASIVFQNYDVRVCFFNPGIWEGVEFEKVKNHVSP